MINIFSGTSIYPVSTLSTADNSFVSKRIDHHYILPEVKLNGNCLRQDSVPFLHKNVVNLYITYELDTWSRDLNIDFTLVNCLFGAVMLTKSDNPDKYGHSGYSTRFDAHSEF